MRKFLFMSITFLLFCLASMAASPTRLDESVMTPFKFQPLNYNQANNSRFKTGQTRFKDLTSKEQKDRLTSKGIRIYSFFERFNENGDKNIPKYRQVRSEEPNYTLTIDLICDKEEIQSVFSVIAYSNNNQEYFEYEIEDEQCDQIEFVLPKGNYDIEVILLTNQEDLVILTTNNINILEDQLITLNSRDATVEIIWNALMPDGSVPCAETPVYNGETLEMIDFIYGNAIIVRNSLKILNQKHNLYSSLLLNYSNAILGDTKIIHGRGNIKAMPNNNYLFYLDKQAISLDGSYIIPLFADDSHSTVVTNDIENYVILKPDFAESPYIPETMIFGEGESQIIWEFDKEKTSCLHYYTISDNQLTDVALLGLIGGEDKLQKWIYVCQDPKSDKYRVMPIPTLIEDWDPEFYNMSGLPIDDSFSSPLVLAMNNTSEFSSYLYLPNDDNIYITDVSNPWLSFDSAKPHIWNYGCPYSVFTTTDYSNARIYGLRYMGYLGENRGTDLITTDMKVTVNNDTPSDEVLEYLQWGELPEEGKIDFEFNNTNVIVDGIPGKNISHLGFDMSRPDWQPPTLQFMRFVDLEKNFTNKYLNSDEGIIELYCGDFKFHEDPETFASWFSEESVAEVKVEYAPYGTDSFLPLEVENIPERNFMPGFGTYYQSYLSNVNRISENGWFDVRITLTDTEGNYQEQILSPAFKIESCVGIETMTASEIGVIITKENITVYGCENPILEIYSTDGILIKRVSSNSVNVSEFTHGIYLVTVKDGNKQTVRKIRV